MPNDDHVRWSKDGGIGRITLHRPSRRNALTAGMWETLVHLATERVLSENVRALVLAGADGAFCSGNDIEMLQNCLVDQAATHRFHQLVDTALQAIRDLPMPTIAAVDGPCFGAGLMLATACDLRVASPGARFCAPPAKLGLVYGIGETRSLVRLVGPARTKEMLFSARVVGCDEALRIGLAERQSDGPAVDAAEALAREVADLSPMTHRASKLLVDAAAAEAAQQPWMDQLRDGATATSDFREGYAAFVAKRRPRF